MIRVLSVPLPSLTSDDAEPMDLMSPLGSPTSPATANEEAGFAFRGLTFTEAMPRLIGLSVLTHFQRRVLVEEEAGAYESYRKTHPHHGDPNKMGESEDESEDQEEEDEGRGNDAGSRTQQRQQNTKKKLHSNITEEDLLEDWYEVLKMPDGESATENELRAAYRQRCLETHPDKDPNHSDVLFKKVQRAFDILGDPDLRLIYDSSRPFDDTIPSEKECKDLVDDEDFFKTFASVFERNKRWSTDPNSLPSLGVSKTPYEKVNKFYTQWSSFRSWRDFSHLADLQEVTEDMCREEKRYYMRENERALASFKKEEMQRIKTLVERAKKCDPRIRRHIAAQEAKRQHEKDEREAFRQKIRDEADRKRFEAERLAKEKVVKEKQEKEAAKQKVMQDLQQVMGFFKERQLLDETQSKKLLPQKVRTVNIKWLISKVNQRPELVAQLLEKVTSSSVEPKPLSDASRVLYASDTTTGSPTTATPQEEVPAVLCFNEFLLQTEKLVGMDRYGEPIKKQKIEPAAASTSASPAEVSKTPSTVWTEEDLSRLQKATAKYPPGSVERWSKIVVMLKDKFTEEEAMAKVSELTAALHAGGAASVLNTVSKTTGVAAVAGLGSSGSPAPAVSSVEDWTVLQQKQLENGLREMKDYKEKDKFQKIAKEVDGKSAKECFERFKYLCSLKKR